MIAIDEKREMNHAKLTLRSFNILYIIDVMYKLCYNMMRK